MMNGFPYVTGIIATNTFNEISNAKGRPILHGTQFESIDRIIFRRYMEEFTNVANKEDFLIVTGENNFKQMYSILPIGSKVVVTSNDGSASEYVVGMKTPRINNQINSGMMSIYEFAMKSNVKRIVVMGGRSVYNMFAGHYSHFVHVEANVEQVGNVKKVNVFPDANHDPANLKIVINGEKPLLSSLINYGMEKFIRVPFDDGKLKVTILDARMENQK